MNFASKNSINLYNFEENKYFFTFFKKGMDIIEIL